jgi:hypothetical protein
MLGVEMNAESPVIDSIELDRTDTRGEHRFSGHRVTAYAEQPAGRWARDLHIVPG